MRLSGHADFAADDVAHVRGQRSTGESFCELLVRSEGGHQQHLVFISVIHHGRGAESNGSGPAQRVTLKPGGSVHWTFGGSPESPGFSQ